MGRAYCKNQLKKFFFCISKAFHYHSKCWVCLILIPSSKGYIFDIYYIWWRLHWQLHSTELNSQFWIISRKTEMFSGKAWKVLYICRNWMLWKLATKWNYKAKLPCNYVYIDQECDRKRWQIGAWHQCTFCTLLYIFLLVLMAILDLTVSYDAKISWNGINE